MSKKNKNGNGWNEYEKLVMDKLSSHEGLIKGLVENFNNFKIDVIRSLDDHKVNCVIVKEFPGLSRDIAGIKASLSNIRKTETNIEDNTKDIGALKTGVAVLEVKSGLWGALGGIVTVTILIITILVKNDFSSIITNMFH